MREAWLCTLRCAGGKVSSIGKGGIEALFLLLAVPCAVRAQGLEISRAPVCKGRQHPSISTGHRPRDVVGI